ncbi:hypothetical protein [Streptomyces yangpuensis]|uniref:hypothetical protein n=1 Tax=Streptomyces yangpuensis TaxID=1648182 RepID=UPI0037FE97FD
MTAALSRSRPQHVSDSEPPAGSALSHEARPPFVVGRRAAADVCGASTAERDNFRASRLSLVAVAVTLKKSITSNAA